MPLRGLANAEQRIPKIRQRMGLTRQQLAEKIGVSARTITAWESGRAIPQGASLMLLLDMEKDPTKP